MPFVNPTLSFTEGEWADPLLPAPTAKAPYRCQEHERCLVAESIWSDGVATNGEWRLKIPISVLGWLPGTQQTLLSISCRAQRVTGIGTWVNMDHTYLWIEGDGVRISPVINVTYAEKGVTDEWQLNAIPLDLNLTDISQLQIVLVQQLYVTTGSRANHVRDITLHGQYYTDVEPPVGGLEITVRDANTARVLPNVPVRLLQGAEVIRDWTLTDSGGIVTWSNLYEGQYTVSVNGPDPTIWTPGYTDEDMTVTVTGYATSAYTVQLVWVDKLPLEVAWYVWVGAGVVAIVGIAGAVYYFKPTFPRAMYERAKREYPRVKARIKRKKS